MTDEIAQNAPPSIHRLIAITNQRVLDNRRPGSNSYSGWLASIRAGITPSGETLAIGAAAPYLTGLTDTQRSSALRAAAIRALNPDVPHIDSRDASVGRSLGRLARLEGGDSISDEVCALPLMPADAAALVLGGLIRRCAKRSIGVNFLNLTSALVYWGTGATKKSQNQRTRIVLDFFEGHSTSASQNKES